jgi:hypothetical protein
VLASVRGAGHQVPYFQPERALYLGISRVGSGSGRAEKNPVEKLMARARPWPGENSKMLARARPQPDPTARGPTR